MTDIDDYETRAEPMSAASDALVPPTSLNHGSTVPVHRTPGRRVVPDVVGLDALDGDGLAREAGVCLSVSVWETKVGPWGMILVQHPSAGARVKPGSRVHVVVSGRPHARVPEVRGLPVEEAIELVRRAGLLPIVAVGRASGSQPSGHVASIRPTAGTLVTDGSVVAIAVVPVEDAAPDGSPDAPLQSVR